MKAPFIYKGNWHVFSLIFFRWIRKRNWRMSEAMMQRHMKQVGCEQAGINFKIAGKSTKRSAWKIPESIISPKVKK